MDMTERKRLRRELLYVFGSLSNASLKTGVEYHRLSRILNGWRNLKPSELKLLKRQIAEAKANEKRQEGL